MVRRTPPELAPAPLCLVGIAAWAGGNGTLLNACCERLAALGLDVAEITPLRDVDTVADAVAAAAAAPGTHFARVLRALDLEDRS